MFREAIRIYEISGSKINRIIYKNICHLNNSCKISEQAGGSRQSFKSCKNLLHKFKPLYYFPKREIRHRGKNAAAGLRLENETSQNKEFFEFRKLKKLKRRRGLRPASRNFEGAGRGRCGRGRCRRSLCRKTGALGRFWD